MALALVVSAAFGCAPSQPAATPTVPGATPATPAAGPATATAVPVSAAPTATSAAPTPSPTPTPVPVARPAWVDLVFVWEGDLWVASASENRQERLTDDGGYSRPSWSPDGNRIVFVRGEGARAQIGTINADGTGKRLLTDTAAANLTPAWSPRGDLIAFTRVADGNRDGQIDIRDEAEVWVMNPDGSGQRRVGAGRDPAWAPEGLRIAFATNGTLLDTPPFRRDNAINLVNTRGENEWSLVTVAKVPPEVDLGGFALSPATTLLKHPSWHPNGSTIAFTTNGHTGLAVSISIRATDLRVLEANYEGGFGRVVWSPWGDMIAVESSPPTGVPEVVIVDATGARLGSVGGVRRGLGVIEPTWSPDGTRLAFSQLEAEPFLGISGIDGAAVKTLAWGRARWPSWVPRAR